ncbi:MAG: formate--tetrahydrofolate ligase, partial [Pseudomonadota bacterium]
ADEALMDQKIRDQLKLWEDQGYGHLPVCMAKTQYSFSTDPNLRGAPTGHSVPVREVRATRGKTLRAEPVAALYEQGRVHHVGAFPDLERQMCRFDGTGSKSPDRLDALVWALTELIVAPPPERAAAAPRVRQV